MAAEHNNSIHLLSGFKRLAPVPLDDSTVVETIPDLNNIPNPYSGLAAYVSTSDAFYYYDGTTWKLQTSGGGGGVTDHTQLTNIGVLTHAQIDKMLGNAVTTGLSQIDGGMLSVNVDTTKFDVSDGSGFIVDKFTDPENPAITFVTWTGLTAQTPTFIAGNNISFVAINAAGSLVQQATSFSTSQRRDLIVLGTLIHTDNVNITATSDQSHDTTSGYLVDDLSMALGDINVSGNNFSSRAADLTLRKEAGESFVPNANRDVNTKNSNFITSPTEDPITWLYAHDDGASGITIIAAQSNVDPDQYDDGSGTLQSVANNKWTNQWCYFFPDSGVIVIRYGTEVFDSLAEAEASVFTTIPPVIGEGLDVEYIRTVITLKKGATNLQDITEGIFTHTGKFGLTGGTGGGAGGTFQDLQDTYDNSITPEILTDATRGALSIRIGSGSDADIGFEILNNALTTNFSVSGEGNVFTDRNVEQSQDDLGNQSGAIVLDMSYSWIKLTLTGNVTGISFSNNPSSTRFRNVKVTFIQDATGSRTVDWAGSGVIPELGKVAADYEVQGTADSVTNIWLSWNGTAWEISIEEREITGL